MLGLKPGTMLDVSHSDSLHEGMLYRSKIYSIEKNKHILIYIPQKYGRDLDFSKSDGSFHILAYTDRYLIKYRCKFVKLIKEDHTALAEIIALGKGEKIQRREFYRLNKIMAIKLETGEQEQDEKEPLSLDALHSILTQQSHMLEQNIILEDILDGEGNLFEGSLLDISGGGIRFHCSKKLEAGNVINAYINLDDEELIMKCTVIGINNSLSPRYKFQYRAKFVDIPQKSQEYILNFIWEEQQMQRKLTGAQRSGLI